MESDRRMVALEPVPLEISPEGEQRERFTPHTIFMRLERVRTGSEEYLSGLATGKWPRTFRARSTSLPPGFDTSWRVLDEAGVPHDVVSIQPVPVPARSNWMLIQLVQREVV